MTEFIFMREFRTKNPLSPTFNEAVEMMTAQSDVEITRTDDFSSPQTPGAGQIVVKCAAEVAQRLQQSLPNWVVDTAADLDIDMDAFEMADKFEKLRSGLKPGK